MTPGALIALAAALAVTGSLILLSEPLITRMIDDAFGPENDWRD